MDAPYVWDHILEEKVCIKNPKTCGPSKWPPLTTGMSYSWRAKCLHRETAWQTKFARLAYKLVYIFPFQGKNGNKNSMLLLTSRLLTQPWVPWIFPKFIQTFLSDSSIVSCSFTFFELCTISWENLKIWNWKIFLAWDVVCGCNHHCKNEFKEFSWRYCLSWQTEGFCTLQNSHFEVAMFSVRKCTTK